MSVFVVTGLSAFVLMSLGFYVTGSQMKAFNILCTIILAATILCMRALWPVPEASLNEMIILISGLLLYWFGLLSVRTMLERSVSLNLLRSYAMGTPPRSIRADIVRRLEDAQRNHLSRRNESLFHLTRFGLVIASIVAVLYQVLRIKE